ncbi:MAG: hypothetical protein WA364_28195 [Candidatus Nitrosopolaris sp.]
MLNELLTLKAEFIDLQDIHPFVKWAGGKSQLLLELVLSMMRTSTGGMTKLTPHKGLASLGPMYNFSSRILVFMLRRARRCTAVTKRRTTIVPAICLSSCEYFQSL